MKIIPINSPEDMIKLRDYIFEYLKFRPYNKETKEHADSIQWKRSGEEIIKDGYVYEGKACSDLTLVFLEIAKKAGHEGYLVKLKTIDGDNTHTIAEVKIKNKWYRIDPSSKDGLAVEGQLPNDKIYANKYKLWKRGHNLKEIGLHGIEDQKNIKIKD